MNLVGFKFQKISCNAPGDPVYELVGIITLEDIIEVKQIFCRRFEVAVLHILLVLFGLTFYLQ